MAYPRVVHKAYPATVNTYMVNVIRPFIHTCLEESRVLMDVFNHKLGLPKDTLINLHDHTKYCISETRCIKVPAAPKGTKMALGQHTDYGRLVEFGNKIIYLSFWPPSLSLSFLANRLGGLQVLIPDNDGSKWKYVKVINHVLYFTFSKHNCPCTAYRRIFHLQYWRHSHYLERWNLEIMYSSRRVSKFQVCRHATYIVLNRQTSPRSASRSWTVVPCLFCETDKRCLSWGLGQSECPCCRSLAKCRQSNLLSWIDSGSVVCQKANPIQNRQRQGSLLIALWKHWSIKRTWLS